MTNQDWIPLAVATQPHGVSGRLKFKSFTDPVRAFATHALTDAQGNAVKLRVTGEAQGQVICEIDGLTRREHAELWRGREIGVPRSALPAPKNDGEFYISDLIGMQVVTTSGTAFGTVADVANFGAGDLLDISLATGGREFFAFTKANFPAQDMDARVLTIDPPELLGNRSEEENPEEGAA